MINLSSQIEQLANRYGHSPVIRALVQLIPFVGSAADAALVTILNNIREERARTFFDELASQDLALTEEQIKSEDFLHAYFATARAALNTRRREKISLFARLFLNYSQGKSFDTVDAYEEALDVLDDLSLQEFKVLLVLDRFEKEHPIQEGHNDLQRAATFWDSFLKAIEAEVGIPASEIPSVLARLNRTGLYLTIIGTYIGYTGDKGFLTPKFAKFLRALKTELTPVDDVG